MKDKCLRRSIKRGKTANHGLWEGTADNLVLSSKEGKQLEKSESIEDKLHGLTISSIGQMVDANLMELQQRDAEGLNESTTSHLHQCCHLQAGDVFACVPFL